MKTKEIINAYKIIKDIKVNSLSEDAALAIWKDVKVFRPIVEEYDKSIEEAKKSLQDDKLKEMNQRAQEYNKYAEEHKGEPMTPEMQKELNEINSYFGEVNAKLTKYIDELQNAEADVEVQKVDDVEMLKALKESGMNFGDMEMVGILTK
jgi:anion-transporting  ArsA/GET3 family ATPase